MLPAHGDLVMSKSYRPDGAAPMTLREAALELLLYAGLLALAASLIPT